MTPRDIMQLVISIFIIRFGATADKVTIPSQQWTQDGWTTEPNDISNTAWMPAANATSTDDHTTNANDVGILADTPTPWEWVPVQWSWVLILQLLFAIIGIVGNLLVLLVLFQRRRHCRSTDTLVAALATADFLTSVFLIPIPKAIQIPDDWTGLAYCKILYPNFLMWMCISASIYTLMAIAIERFIAVVFPLYFNRTLTRRAVSMWVVFIWVASFLSGLRGVILFRVNNVTHKCSIQYRNNLEKVAYGCFVFAIRIVIPTLTMFITQCFIALTLHRQSTRFGNPEGGTDQATFHVVAKNRVLKMMVIVILLYVVCWSPNQIAFFGFNLGLVPSSYRYSNLNSIFTLLGFFNSCANPIVYTARHPEFRKAIKGLFYSGPVKPHSLFGHQEPTTSVTVIRKSANNE